jgi:hypothetical protein
MSRLQNTLLQTRNASKDQRSHALFWATYDFLRSTFNAQAFYKKEIEKKIRKLGITDVYQVVFRLSERTTLQRTSKYGTLPKIKALFMLRFFSKKNSYEERKRLTSKGISIHIQSIQNQTLKTD